MEGLAHRGCHLGERTYYLAFQSTIAQGQAILGRENYNALFRTVVQII